MNQIEIPAKNIVINVPSEIDEMTNEQFVQYIFHVLQYLQGKINENQFKLIMAIILLDVRKGSLSPFMSRKNRNAVEENISRIAELMDCFIELQEEEGNREFKLKSVRNFIPKILNYYGPGNCFQNLTYCEYRTARGYFKSYVLDGKEEDLNKMIAVLYRPSKRLWFLQKYLKSSDGERRIVFKSKNNPIYFLSRTKKISKVPFHIRYAVFIYFSACEDFLKTGKPEVDGIELDLSKLYTKGSSDTSKTDVGMVGLLYSLAETAVFGSIEQTDNSNLWDIMIRLYQVVMQMQEIEEINKKK